MELNTRGRYAVMAMADLARRAGPSVASSSVAASSGASAVEAIPLSEIAERQHISLAYLEQLFQRLRKAGLVESLRGRSGGYALALAPEAITIAAILQAVEEPVKMTRCQIGLEGRAEGGCVGHERCITHDLWDALGDHIASFFHGVSLRDVVEGMPLRRHPATAFVGAAAE